MFDRANALGRVLVSQDTDMLAEATGRLRRGVGFVGVVFWPQQTMPAGAVIKDLELLSVAGTTDDVRNQIIFLPL